MPTVKTRKGYKIRYSSGKIGNKVYKTKEEAEARVKQIEMWKHMKKN